MKNHHLDLVRVTEAAAISAAEWVGRGDKESADRAASDAMRDRLNMIDFYAEIAIGEGKKDKSFGLFDGERVGSYHLLSPVGGSEVNLQPSYSIAVDPIEGTTPTAKGGYEAMSVIALGNQGCFFKTDCFYMLKMAVGPRMAKVSKFLFDITTAAPSKTTSCGWRWP
jgi:fructose-1,6-bisphosphatase/sedoheptulose 1,7-bisphosphatase-like protein